MTNPTSNFGWQMPTSTDLVTDLPADFEVFGQAVDTDFVDLLGGTTGQVLSKTSGTDLDFTWVTANPGDITGVTAGTGISGGGTSGTVTVTNDMATTITAAGDIVVGTGSGTYDNLPIGTTAQVLTADTTVSPYKVKWATPAASGMTLITRASFSGVATTTTTFDNVFTSSYTTYYVVLEKIIADLTQLKLQFRYAGPTTEAGSNYYGSVQTFKYTGTAGSVLTSGLTKLGIAPTTNELIQNVLNFTVTNVGNSSQYPCLVGEGYTAVDSVKFTFGGELIVANTYTGLIFSASSGNITGTISVFGLAKQ